MAGRISPTVAASYHDDQQPSAFSVHKPECLYCPNLAPEPERFMDCRWSPIHNGSLEMLALISEKESAATAGPDYSPTKGKAERAKGK